MKKEDFIAGAFEMERVWGLEWEALSHVEAIEILWDFHEAACSADQYLQMIGTGNLLNYVEGLWTFEN